MGWQIAQKGGKFRIWSTVSDTWFSKWISREEVLKLYHDEALLAFKQSIIKHYLAFPNYWTDHETGKIVHDDKERSQAYVAWMKELSSKKDEEAHCAFINETYEKIMKELEKTE